jgi:hypothetical protein
LDGNANPGTNIPAPAAANSEALFWAEGWLQERSEVFKQPASLNWLAQLQEHLHTARGSSGQALVGKSNSLADMVRTIHRDLYAGNPEAYRVPDRFRAVGQTINQLENSHRPHDLAHFVTLDQATAYRHTNLWLQLKSGDNADMTEVVETVQQFIHTNPPPATIEATPHWFGLTYINVKWQEQMVGGMRDSFLGSFVIVLIMMTLLFRSLWWGLLSMIPLTVTIAGIYGVIGFIGKDFDMPVAVLSSLTLGLAIDFAIHFLERARELYREHGSWQKAMIPLYAEPARAISRNIIVIAAGFTPLLLAPLIPYQTVGILLATILVVSGAATMIILPALLRLGEGLLFKRLKPGSPNPATTTSSNL